MKNIYSPSMARSIIDIFSCWIIIILSAYLTLNISYWFYPFSILLIGNRILALSLICHEGLHGNLSNNRFWNEFLGRYLCAFPTISFNKYRRVHILHHNSVGSELWDPDLHLYNFFPVEFDTYIKKQIIDLLTLRTCWSFLKYYTDIPDLIKIIRGEMSFGRLHKSSDWLSFVIFNVILNLILVLMGWWWFYILFYILPLIIFTQPYVLLMGGLQHGPPKFINTGEGVSRTIVGSRWYMWLLLPLNINFHAEHHLNPRVPHYRLSKFAEELKKEKVVLCHQNYVQAIRDLFHLR